MNEPLVDVTGARRRRARARLKRRLVVAGVAAGVLGLVGGGLWVVYASPVLAATEVEVSGNAIATTEQVVSAAAVPLGSPLASVDTTAVRARVLEGLPAVADVTVTRSWPSTVSLAVTEWTPEVVVELPGSWVWISGDGDSFHTSEERPEGVMVARGGLADEDILLTLASVAGSLPPAVRDQAEHIEASTVDSVTITLKDDRRIVWGSAEDAQLKGDVLVPLLQVPARVYDVSAPTHPTTR